MALANGWTPPRSLNRINLNQHGILARFSRAGGFLFHSNNKWCEPLFFCAVKDLLTPYCSLTRVEVPQRRLSCDSPALEYGIVMPRRRFPRVSERG